MANLQKQPLRRKFVLVRAGKRIDLQDPDQSMTPEAVMKFYSAEYPELVNSSVQAPSYEEDAIVFEFKTIVGTKG